MAIVYQIINDINGKIYIGKTSDTIEQRFKEHCTDFRKSRCEKRPLYDAMSKYGVKHFSIQEIESGLTDDEACEREQYWIGKLRTYIGFKDCNGYNATLGGDSRRYYNYEEIANKYLELQNQKETAKYFNCDTHTVRKACKELEVEIHNNGETLRIKKRKEEGKIKVITPNGTTIYDNIDEVVAFIQNQEVTFTTKARIREGIRNVLQGKRKSYLSFVFVYTD